MSQQIPSSLGKAQKVSRGTLIGQLLPWLFPIALIALWQLASAHAFCKARILPHQCSTQCLLDFT